MTTSGKLTQVFHFYILFLDCLHQIRDQSPPCSLARRQLALIRARRFGDVARAAKCLQSARIVGILARLAFKRRDVVALKTSSSPA